MVVDSHPRSGRGHICRSQIMAALLRESGVKVTEILIGTYDPVLTSAEAAFHMDELEIATEATGLWVLIDAYSFDDVILELFKLKKYKLMGFEALGINRRYFDVIIDPFYNHVKESDVKLLQGFEYQPIDPRLGLGTNCTSREIQNVLITFGAFDSMQLCEKTALAMIENNFGGQLSIAINPGISTSRQSQLRRMNEEFGVEIIFSGDDLVSFMPNYDFIIGSVGNSLIERCLLGIPSLSCAVNSYQKKALEFFVHRGCTIPFCRDSSSTDFWKIFTDTCKDPKLLDRLIRRGLSLGVARNQILIDKLKMMLSG